MSFLFLALAAASASAGASPNFDRASVPGVYGEASNLYLIPDGAYAHPLYNDFNGDTDKLLTTSLKAGVLREHWELTYFWRLFTPSVKPAFRAENLKKPVGIFADWMEVEGAYAVRYALGPVAVKHQLMAGVSHIGNKGGRNLQRAVHRLTHNTLENTDYTGQPAGAFATAGYELAVEGNLFAEGFSRLDQQLAVVGAAGKAGDEVGLKHNVVFVVRRSWWELASEVKVVRQFRSGLFEGLRPYRLEGSLGTLLYGWFSPAVKYVSPYLLGDGVGQTYFDFFHYNWAF